MTSPSRYAHATTWKWREGIDNHGRGATRPGKGACGLPPRPPPGAPKAGVGLPAAPPAGVGLAAATATRTVRSILPIRTRVRADTQGARRRIIDDGVVAIGESEKVPMTPRCHVGQCRAVSAIGVRT